MAGKKKEEEEMKMNAKENGEGLEMNELLESQQERGVASTKKKARNQLKSFFVEESEDGSGLAEDGSGERLRWDSYMEYFLSIIGFVIDLGNVWR